jgi:hypothetical protein
MSTFTRNLWVTSPMMRGSDIGRVQVTLQSLGFKVGADGLFGRETANAVEDFQRKKGITIDGVVGRMTWASLFNEPAAPPDRLAGDVLDGGQISALKALHTHFAGAVRWQVSNDGLTVEGDPKPLFNAADEREVGAVMTQYGSMICAVTAKIQVPIELIVACICIESSGKADAIRHEPGCSLINPELTPQKISIGLTQTLLSTAREALQRPTLHIADLCDPALAIEAGASYMWRQGRLTGFDPPLVGAAYNAGSLRFDSTAQNRWRLVQYPIGTPQYDDRFIRFFNAAMGGAHPIFDGLDQSLKDRTPSLRKVL